MGLHWKVLAWMLAGVLVGAAIQRSTDGRGWSGATAVAAPDGGGVVLTQRKGPAAKLPGDVHVTAVVTGRGSARESRVEVPSPQAFAERIASLSNGDVLWLERPGKDPVLLVLGLDPEGARARWIAPFAFVADLFMALLRMLIVPLVGTSILVGVAGLGGGRELGRLGAKTFGYYIATSVLAILVGQVLVTVFAPGAGANLGLTPTPGETLAGSLSFVDQVRGIVPSNFFAALTDNGAMLQLIFGALLFGIFLGRAPEPHRTRVLGFFESLLAVIMALAEGILKLIPYGVFALLVKVVADTGFAVFRPLLAYMAVVTGALLLHGLVTLPLVLRLVGGVSPLRWARAMAPALVTAFSTSSSSLTLPVSLETVESRGKVSSKITSFTLPLGATVNMDGTALYECIGVTFLAQVYAGLDPTYTLTLADQGLIVLMALMASIGAAGIPSAGLVMMLTILGVLGLPLEGAALLLAVDRPLDMLRTVINVWSDTCGAAVVARSEGEALEGLAIASA
ncbi:MAG TPA: dicarboxylate/amino acid:cation symporter [Planctomycetota bacterium]|nr:dicarboxylate/amino acid:cation symporter [Planctomycetota bacterium]